jgi:hypothetical protein
MVGRLATANTSDEAENEADPIPETSSEPHDPAPEAETAETPPAPTAAKAGSIFNFAGNAA